MTISIITLHLSHLLSRCKCRIDLEDCRRSWCRRRCSTSSGAIGPRARLESASGGRFIEVLLLAPRLVQQLNEVVGPLAAHGELEGRRKAAADGEAASLILLSSKFETKKIPPRALGSRGVESGCERVQRLTTSQQVPAGCCTPQPRQPRAHRSEPGSAPGRSRRSSDGPPGPPATAFPECP